MTKKKKQEVVDAVMLLIREEWYLEKVPINQLTSLIRNLIPRGINKTEDAILKIKRDAEPLLTFLNAERKTPLKILVRRLNDK